MNTEQYRHDGWEKFSLWIDEARRNPEFQEALRTKKSKEDLVQFLKDPGDFDVPKFVDQDIIEVLLDMNNVRNYRDIIAPQGYFWLYLKLDEDFLEMK
jgi:hypothetical protein